MRKFITVVVIVVVATIAAAWAVSMPEPGSANRAVMGGGGAPTHSPLLW